MTPEPAEPVRLRPIVDRFLTEYLVDQNGHQAAVRAGYSPKTARSKSTTLLAIASVKAELARRTAALMTARVATAQQVLERLTLIGMANPKRFVDAAGAYRGLDELSDDDAAAIQQIDIVQANLDPSDGRRDSARVVKIRLHDQVRALETLAKYHNLMVPKVEHSGTITIRHELADDAPMIESVTVRQLEGHRPALGDSDPSQD